MSLPKPYYQDESCTIYHGDCREILPHLEPVDLVLTDPPFSDATHKNAKSNRTKGHGNSAIDFECLSIEDMHIIFDMIANLATRWVVSFLDYRHIFRIEQTPPKGLDFIRFGVWVKTNPMPQISCDRPANGWDGIAYLHKSNRQKFWAGGGCHGNYIGPVVTDGAHPTGKPISFLRTLVERFSVSGGEVLDPFMGSGTTLRAAKDLGRKAIGIELEEKYCEVAAKRLRQEVFNF